MQDVTNDLVLCININSVKIHLEKVFCVPIA